MTVPRGTDSTSADDGRTQALATPHAPAATEARPDAEGAPPSGAASSGDRSGRHGAGTDSPPEQGSSEPAAAVPRAGAPRAESPEERPAASPDAGSGWSQGGGERATSSDSERTTVLPGAGARPSAPRPAAARPAVRSEPRAAGAARPLTGRTRRARLSLRRIDPWSVFLFSLVASVFLGLALIVAVAALYAVLGTLGVTESINQLFAEVTGGSPTTGALLTSGRIIGGSAVLAAVNVVFLTLLATLSALLYNLCASFTGGIELTLGERD